MGKIILNFPAKTPREEKNQLTESVNNHLADISGEVNSWSGFVDVVKTVDNQYEFIGKCDNEDVRSKMQGLLDKMQIALYTLVAGLKGPAVLEEWVIF